MACCGKSQISRFDFERIVKEEAEKVVKESFPNFTSKFSADEQNELRDTITILVRRVLENEYIIKENV